MAATVASAAGGLPEVPQLQVGSPAEEGEAVTKQLQIRDPDDEAVGYGQFHIERMDRGHWWIGVKDEHGCELSIWLGNKRYAEVKARMEITGRCREEL